MNEMSFEFLVLEQFSCLFNEGKTTSMRIIKLIKMHKVKTMETPLVKIHYGSRCTWNGKCSFCQCVDMEASKEDGVSGHLS